MWNFVIRDSDELLTETCSLPSVTTTQHLASAAGPCTSPLHQTLSLTHCSHWWMTTVTGCWWKRLVFAPLSPSAANMIHHFNSCYHKLYALIYTHIKKTFVRYLLDSRWSDRSETLHVNRVGYERENSQGPMSIALCYLKLHAKIV